MILEKVRNEDIQNGVYEIPEGITEIGYCAFEDCISLTQITLPEGVTEIGYASFTNCRSLAQITLPQSITKIGISAFAQCINLRQITIPEGVAKIEDYVFYDCWNLTQITLPKSVTEIGNYVFYNCWNLRQITIPKVTKIGDYAFSNCTNLERVIRNTHEIKTRCIDGSIMQIKSQKELKIEEERYLVYLCNYLFETEKIYVVKKGNYTAHGATLRQAIEKVIELTRGQKLIKNDYEKNKRVTKYLKWEQN